MRIPGSFNEEWAGQFGSTFGFKPSSSGLELPVFNLVPMYAFEREDALGGAELTSWPASQGGATLTPLALKAPDLQPDFVAFNGTDDIIKSGALTWSPVFHVFAVCANGAGAAGATNVIISSEATSNAVRWYYNRGAVRMDCTLWQTSGAVVVPASLMPVGGEGTLALFEIDVDAASARLRTNGVAGSSVVLANPVRSTSQVLHVGGRTDTPSDPAALEIRALVIYMADITAPQAQEVRDYLNAKYIP